jgi:MFS transporter, YNFM family, putative membrane transport protein
LVAFSNGKPVSTFPENALDGRRIAVALAGFCTFVNLYMPQALLPLLARDFAVGAAEISAVITASTLAIALTAPFTGALADVLGRKRVITAAIVALVVPTMLVAFAPNVPALILFRFLQGLLLPPIFVVIVAYIGEEWPPAEVPGITGLYVAGSGLGGFAGRFITGILADLTGWRGAFLAVAAITVASAAAVAWLLPPERKFVRSEGLSASLRQMLRHLRNPRLIATYAIGFGVLFNFIATFTYVSFHLAAPPYWFSPSLLGAIFCTYLAGTLVTPLAGRAISRFGRRAFMVGTIVVWAGGAALLLAPPLPAIIAGLTLCAACGMLCQAVSTGTVTTIAKEGRSSAVGLYVTWFYVGGSAGAALPGLAWTIGGWPACVAMIIGMLTIMAVVVATAWPRQ